MLASVYFSLNEHDKELYYAQYQAKAQSAEARLTPVKMELDNIYESFINDNNSETSEITGGFNSLIWILVGIICILIIGVIALHQYAKRTIMDKSVTATTNDKLSEHSFEDNYNTFVIYIFLR